MGKSTAPRSVRPNKTMIFGDASGLVKMGRGAVGARLEPKGGLQTYFEPKSASQR